MAVLSGLQWDKPEEFALFEQALQMQTQQQNPSHHLKSMSSVLSTQHSAQTQQVQIQTQAFHQTLQLQKPCSSAPVCYFHLIFHF